jgi:hypothetical protein
LAGIVAFCAGAGVLRRAVPRPARRRVELLLVAHVIVLAICCFGLLMLMKAVD